MAEQVKQNYEFAKLSPRQKALSKFAELVTRTPSAVRPQDLDTLRKHGLTDLYLPSAKRVREVVQTQL